MKELTEWIKEQDLPDPDAILDGKETFTHNSMRLDRTHAVLNSCTARVAPVDAPNRKDRSRALWKLLRNVMEDAQDVAAPVAISLYQAKLIGGPDAKFVLAQMKDMLKATSTVF